MKENDKIKQDRRILIGIIIFTFFSIFMMYLNGNALNVKKTVYCEYGEDIKLSPEMFFQKNIFSNEQNEDVLENCTVEIEGILNKETKFAIGEYNVLLTYNNQSYNSKLVVQDTIAPVFEDVEMLEIELGYVEYDFAEKVKAKDLQEITYKFDDQAIDYHKLGTYTVCAEAVDSSGNRATKNIDVVVKDTVAPLFEVIDEISVAYGDENFDFSTVVLASDEQEITYSYDTSMINYMKSASYNLDVVATDASNNSASETFKVQIQPLTLGENGQENQDFQTPKGFQTTGDAELDKMCDKILSKIIKDGMTNRDKLKAVYDWIETHLRYSTSTKEGDWRERAKKVLSIRKGNCMAYCYASEALITRLGFENIEIINNGKEHYWNMVKCDGTWYHWDSSPGWGCERFLWNTNQIKKYRYRPNNFDYGKFNEKLYPTTP